MKGKRLIAVLLAVFMIMTLVPAGVWAEEPDSADVISSSETLLEDTETVSKEAQNVVETDHYNDLDLNSAVPLSIGADTVSVSVDLSESAPYKLFALDVQETGTYTFVASGRSDDSIDPYGALIQVDGDSREQIAFEDDDNDGGGAEDRCFSFSWELDSGNTYYFLADQYDSEPASSGSYQLTIRKQQGISLTFDANGGYFQDDGGEQISEITGSVLSDASLTELENFYMIANVMRDGYELAGWSRDPEASDPEKTADLSWTTDESGIWYAVWWESITATFDANGGFIEKDGENVPTCEMAVGAGTTLDQISDMINPWVSREDDEGGVWNLIGWADHAEAGPEDILPGDTAITANNCTFYAVWESSSGDNSYIARGCLDARRCAQAD